MRYVSIDALRTLAIVLMVAVHFAENLAEAHPSTAAAGPWALAVWVPGEFAAPLFTFLSGVSYRLWVRGRESRGDKDEAITKSSIRRGLFLFGLGIAFNVLVWLPEDMFNWDVLTFLGVAMLVLTTTRAAPSGVHLLAAAAAAAVSPALRELSDYAAFWTPGYFDPDLTLADVGLGFLSTGYFPVFPWIAYPLVGYVVAPAVFPGARDRGSRWPVALGSGLMAVAVTMLIVRNTPAASWLPPFGGWSMFPATTAYVFFTLGALLVGLPQAHRLLDRGGVGGRFMAVTGIFSRHSLTIYILHHVIHLWPLWAWGAATAEDPTEHWRNAMPMTAALGLAAVFLVAVYPLLCLLDRTGRAGIEGWMRWLCEDDRGRVSSEDDSRSNA